MTDDFQHPEAEESEPCYICQPLSVKGKSLRDCKSIVVVRKRGAWERSSELKASLRYANGECIGVNISPRMHVWNVKCSKSSQRLAATVLALGQCLFRRFTLWPKRLSRRFEASPFDCDMTRGWGQHRRIFKIGVANTCEVSTTAEKGGVRVFATGRLHRILSS